MKSIFVSCAVVLAALVAYSASGADDEGGPKPDELFKQLDKNNDGTLTSDEVGEERAKLFDRVVRRGDKDKDGKLTHDEFLEGFKDGAKGDKGDKKGGGKGKRGEGKGPGEGRSDIDPEEAFNHLDENKDGKLTRDELPEQARERMGKMFERLGKDEITKEEFINTVNLRRRGEDGDGPQPEGRKGRFGKRRPQGEGGPEGAEGGPQGRREGRGPMMVSPLIRLLDTDNDKMLSKEELSKAADKFSELDTNKDGKLDGPELMGMPPGFGRLRGEGGEGPRGRGPRGEGKGGPEEGDRGPERGDGRKGRGPEGKSDGKGAAGGPGGRFFERFDKDGDGKISDAEAPEFLKERFKSIDTNNDGVLSAEEFRKSAERRRGQDGPKGGEGDKESPPEKKPAPDEK